MPPGPAGTPAPQPPGPVGHAFLAEAVHQLRTPLTPLMMLAHLLREDPALPAHLRGHVELLGENIDQAAQLIDELGDFGHWRLGRLAIRTQPVDLAELVRGQMSRHVPAASARIALRSDLPAQAPIAGDGPRLSRLIETMLMNAIAHAPADTSVTITLVRQDAEWVLSISDQGPGIAAGEVETLFTLAEPAWIRGRGFRLGIGLLIGRRVAELHQGRLEIHVPPTGRGAAFVLAIPVDQGSSP